MTVIMPPVHVKRIIPAYNTMIRVRRILTHSTATVLTDEVKPSLLFEAMRTYYHENNDNDSNGSSRIKSLLLQANRDPSQWANEINATLTEMYLMCVPFKEYHRFTQWSKRLKHEVLNAVGTTRQVVNSRFNRAALLLGDPPQALKDLTRRD